MRDESLFYPKRLMDRAATNVERFPWASEIQQAVITQAKPWMGFSDDDLWNLMFGHTIKRSWMVWSNGHCPACKTGVPMYSWRIDPLKEPWKLRCPHCEDVFPKNDFHAFYLSGLDAGAVFDPEKADRSLLYNTEHPEPDDPLRDFGVDGGEGYREGENTWWFIGTYLVYGQWKRAVHAGITGLAAAYTVTGDGDYAHKALVLLDRVADLYPSFDFKAEGVMYEGPADRGYVSTWHDACEETREMALAYDQVRGAVPEDEELVRFLSGKARAHGIRNPKASPEDVCRNIEDGILRHPLENSGRISTNYPRREIALVILKTVLDYDGFRADITEMVREMMERATAIDGVTGEKGLAGYTAGVIQSMAQFIERYTRIEPDFLAGLAKDHPKLLQTYRFHMDMWCQQEYYPQAGDTGSFARKFDRYVGANFNKAPGLLPSTYSLFWRFYELTGDPAYVQVLHHANDGLLPGLPYDLFAEDPEAFQGKVQKVIEEHGTEIAQESVNKSDWRIAVLRSGTGDGRRAAWIDYDSGGGHGHMDGMNLGLIAKGLDLMPDFGYPPVQYGGWKGSKFHWYVSTPGHNTVAIDGRDQERTVEGEHRLWGAGTQSRAIRVSGTELYNVDQYERTIAMVDISDQESYVVDVFRVVGGADHAKFMHGHFGTVTTSGLTLETSEEYGFDTQMKEFQTDRKAQPGWSADWQVEDRFNYLPPGEQVHLKYVDLTTEAEASVAQAWVALGGYGGLDEAWIPRLMIRRQAEDAPLASTFVGVIEPYGTTSAVESIRRLELETGSGVAYPDTHVAIEVTLTDGRRDLIVSADAENARGLEPSWNGGAEPMVVKDIGLEMDAELGVVRLSPSGEATGAAIWNGKGFQLGEAKIDLTEVTEFTEVDFT